MTDRPPPAPRSRSGYAALGVATVLIGLASRRFAALMPAFVETYVGDALWAAMVFWLAALVAPRARTVDLAVGAFAAVTAVEVSQLYHPAWLDAWRATRLGALALGHGFLWTDLACYAAGVATAAVLDRMLRLRRPGLSEGRRQKG